MGYDYLLIGEYDFEIENKKVKTPFRIKIKDTKPPTITDMPKEIEVTKGSVIDWGSYFKAEDLSGVEYSANQDVLQYMGDHFVEVTISDHFGNSINHTVKVIVK